MPINVGRGWQKKLIGSYGKEKLMKTIYVFILLIINLSLCGCFGEKWEGFVYPDKNDLTVYKNIGVYNSLEACRSASLNKLSALGATNRGDYECGLNCKKGNVGSVKICEQTKR